MWRLPTSGSMPDQLEPKRIEIVGRMKALKTKLDTGDDSELLTGVLAERTSAD
jgi:hypothetical protein